MLLVDTHCHLDVCDFDRDRQEVLKNARKLGVGRIVIPGIRKADWPQLIALCETESDLYPALGLHPYFLDSHVPQDVAALQQVIERYHPVAVGEIGLDFFRPELDRERQLALFEDQLSVAKAADLPVILHNRKAHDQMLSMLKKNPVKGGICHAFNGSFQQAQQYIDLGFKLGFGGMLTYERSSKLRKLAAHLPIESIVLETDAPDMPPASHQYQRNSPEYLPEILEALAQVRGEPASEMARQTTANACAVFDLPARLQSM
jgi:TatD DNase family protein